MDKENLKPKRRKKSYRNFHDRRKNDIRKRQAKTREALSVIQLNTSCESTSAAVTPTPTSQQLSTKPTHEPETATQPLASTSSVSTQSQSLPNSTLLQRHHPNLSFEDMRQQLSSAPPSAAWTPVHSATSIQLCMMKVSPMSQAKVERSITVNTDMSRHVHVAGKLVSTNKVLKEFPSRVSDVKCLQHMMQCVERAHLCPGNPQPEFVEVVNKRASSNKAAYVDSEVEVIDVDGQMYGRTVRRSDWKKYTNIVIHSVTSVMRIDFFDFRISCAFPIHPAYYIIHAET